MDFESLILAFIRLLLGTIFLASFTGKARESRHFVTTLMAFKLIPTALTQQIAFTLIGAELIVAILLLLGWQTRVIALLCALLLISFSFAIGVNLTHGNTELECGCFGAKYNQKISSKLIFRNILLLLAALFLVFWGGGSLALDSHPLLLKRMLMLDIFLPVILISIGVIVLLLIVRQLLRILPLTTLEDR